MKQVKIIYWDYKVVEKMINDFIIDKNIFSIQFTEDQETGNTITAYIIYNL